MTRCLPLALLLACSVDQGDDGPSTKKDTGVTDTGTPDSGVSNGFDMDTVAGEIAAANCSFLTRCVPEFYEASNQNEQQCTAEAKENLLANFTDLSDLLAEGRVRFQADQKDLCITAFQTADCLLGVPDDSPCNRVLNGTQALNQACFFGAECQDRLYCSRAQGVGSCGTCAEMPDRGDSCDPFTPCQANTRCLDVGQTAPMYMCIPIDAQQGQTCLTIPTGLCEGGLNCIGTQMAGFSCQPPAGPSAMCSDQGAQPLPDCDLGDGYVCAMGTCQTSSWVDLGGMCGDTTLCRDGFCDMASSLCAPLPGIGQSCAMVGACGEDAFCDTQNCLPLIASGQPCNASGECTGELVCLGAGVGRQGSCGVLEWQKCQ